jgi:hypothetical protein
MRLLTGRGRPVVPLAGRRRAMGAGTGLFLIAVGAILLFAVPAGSLLGLNLRVVGVIVIVIGVLGLLLPAAMQGPRPDGLSRWVNPSGVDDPSVHDTQSAASADVSLIREDDELFDPDGPGNQGGEL